ncbi:MAG: hypothetical protein Q7R49_02145 [Candidatus Daviesbacteria bacterium]|nr:hypothetical protein [Candidatus Daviesbacteria bacterium]
MLIWAALFLIIIAISAILAYQSMRDYQIKPTANLSYGLFLIKNPLVLTTIFDTLHDQALQSGYLISLERLFKGSKSALVIFAPHKLINALSPDLQVVELEEYAKIDPTYASVWEMGYKDQASFHLGKINAFDNLPQLRDDEQFWWQITLQANSAALWPKLDQKKLKTYQINLQKMISASPELKSIAETKNQQKTFHAEIRAVLISSDHQRRESLIAQLTHLNEGKLVKIPKPYTSEQLLGLYQKRAKMSVSNSSLSLTTEEVLQLCGVRKS